MDKKTHVADTYAVLPQFLMIYIAQIILLCLWAVWVLPFQYGPWRLVYQKAKTYMPLEKMVVDDDTVVVVNKSVISYFVPQIQTKNPVLGFHTGDYDFPNLPHDKGTIQ